MKTIPAAQAAQKNVALDAPLLPHRQPDASLHDPRPEYLRSLIERAGVSQREAAERIGIGHRLLKYYLTTPGHTAQYRVAPYPVQYALEELAAPDHG